MLQIIHFAITIILVITCCALVYHIVKLHERIDVLQDVTESEYEFLEDRISDMEGNGIENSVIPN